MITLDVMPHRCYEMSSDLHGERYNTHDPNGVRLEVVAACRWRVELPDLPTEEGRYELHDGNWRRVGG